MGYLLFCLSFGLRSSLVRCTLVYPSIILYGLQAQTNHIPHRERNTCTVQRKYPPPHAFAFALTPPQLS